jgi:hypothetical protein
MDIDDALDHLVIVVDRWRGQEDISEAGGRRICRMPWVAPMKYLHILYPPLPTDDIASIAPRTGRQPPADYQRLLSRFNGLSIFGSSLAIFGVRSHYDRRPEAAMWQPFDIGPPHIEQYDALGRDDVVVGCVGPDVDYIVMRAISGDVARLDHNTKKLQETWPSLAEFIVGETDRYAAHHTTDGHLDPDTPLAPGKASPWPQENLSAIKPRPFSPLWWDRLWERLGLGASQ